MPGQECLINKSLTTSTLSHGTNTLSLNPEDGNNTGRVGEPLVKRVLALVIIVGLVLGAGIMGRAYLASGRAPKEEYVTAQSFRGDLRVVVSGSGNVVPIATQALRSGVASQVGRVHVVEGQVVAKGDLLVTLENKSALTAYEQAKLDLDLARLRLEELITPAAADIAAAEFKVAQAELTLANRQADERKLTVASPATGTLTIKTPVKTNVTTTSVLGVIEDATTLRMQITVPLQYRAQLVPGFPVEINFGSIHPLPVKGTVIEVATEATQTSRGTVIAATVELANPGTLVPGMAGSARLVFGGADEVFSSGTLTMATRADARPEIQGTLVEWLVENGAWVEAGQVIAKLDNETVRLSVRQAQQDLTSAQSNLERLISPDRTTSTEVRNQELRVRQAEMTLDTRLSELESLEVRAPFAGTVMQVAVTAGERVTANAALVTLADLSQMLLTINVDELDISRIHLGQTAEVKADALRAESFRGEVVKLATEGTVREGVTSYAVTFRIDTPGPLRTGMTVTADIFIAEKSGVVMVPVEAIQEREGQKVVRVLGEDGIVRIVPVQLGLSNSTHAEIVSGLTTGTSVIVAQVSTAQTGLGTRLPGIGSMFQIPSGLGGGRR